MAQMQQLMQRTYHHPISAEKCVMVQQHHFDGSNPSAARNHWVAI